MNKNKQVCLLCFSDIGLKSFIEKNGRENIYCSFCHSKNAKSIGFEKLINFIFDKIKHVYFPYTNLPDSIDFEFESTYIRTDDLSSLYGITKNNILHQTIIQSLNNKSKYWSIKENKGLFHQWRFYYNGFQIYSKTVSQLGQPNQTKILNEDHNISDIKKYATHAQKNNFLQKIKNLIDKHHLKTILEKDFYITRARFFKEKGFRDLILSYSRLLNNSKNKEVMPFQKQQERTLVNQINLSHLTPSEKKPLISVLGPPASEDSKPTRMSPAHFPVFYCSSDAIVVLSEVTVRAGENNYQQTNNWQKQNVIFAEFSLQKPIAIIDLSKIPEIPSFFEANTDNSYRDEIITLSAIAQEFSKPIEKDGQEHFEYSLTQHISYFLKESHFDFELENKYPQGIRYPSATDTGIEGKGFSYGFFIRRDVKEYSFEDFFLLESLQTPMYKLSDKPERTEYVSQETLLNLNKQIELFPDNFMLYGNRGAIQIECGKLEEAIEDLDKAIELKSNSPQIYYNRGLAKIKLSQYENAIEDFNKAIELNKNYFHAYCDRGLAKFNIKKYNEAIQDFDRSIELNSNYFLAYCNRGRSKAVLGYYEEATKDFEEAIRLKPDFSEAYVELGSTKIDLGKYKEAREDFNKAIELNPNSIQAYCNRGFTQAMLGHYEEAKKDFEEVIKLTPDLPNIYEIYSNLGFTQMHLGKPKEAIENFNKAIELNPELSQGYYYRGRSKNKLGDYEGAIEDFNKAIELNKNYFHAYFDRGSAKANLGQYENAIEDFNQTIDLDKNHPLAYLTYYNRGRAKTVLGHYEEAKKDFEKVAQLKSDFTDSYESLDL